MIYPYRKLIKPPLGSRPYKGYFLSKGRKGYWLFNEGSGNKVFDLSGNGNTGTFGAGAASPTWVPGKFGSALSFDGGDYITIANEANFDFTTSFSIVIGFKRGDTSNPVRLINKPGNADFWKNSFTVLFTDDAPANRVQAYFQNTGDVTQTVYSTAAMTDTTEWHQVAVVWNSSENKWYLYIDGILNNTAATTGIPVLNANNVFLGAGDATNEHFTGLIDIPTIYNRALTSNEAVLLYRESFWTFKDPNEWAILGGFTAPVVGAAGIMTTNPGIWGPTF